jgi:hypothetical protein
MKVEIGSSTGLFLALTSANLIFGIGLYFFTI